jgi:hypothetical protein
VHGPVSAKANSSRQKTAARLKANGVNLKTALVASLFVLLNAGTASAADLHPIIEIETGYFFGASENGQWVKSDQAARSVANKTIYQVYSLTEQVGQITADKPASVEEPCPDTLMVSLSSKPKDGVIGLAAPWNALPRKPIIADTTQSVYVDAVRDFLKAHGMADPKVRITRIIRIDLEGDGEDEVLINATNYFNQRDEAPINAPKRGSYSIVMLRRVVAGKVKTQLVTGELYSRADASNAPNIYKVAAVLDLNGDRKLEVIVHSFYYEGGETIIYRCEPDKIEPALSVECGA